MNYQNNANANTYKNMEVSSSNRLKIIVMVYDAVIASLKEAIETHGRNDMVKRNQYISRAQFIILELNSALDMQRGEEIAENLRKIYHFLNRHLGDFLNDNDIRKVRESLKILESIRESWKAIEKENETGSQGAAVYHSSRNDAQPTINTRVG